MFADICRANLLKIARAYAKAEGVPLKTVSSRAYGNPQFFEQLASGRSSVSIDKFDELLGWFRKNWPEQADWPFLRLVHMSRNPTRP